MFRQLFKEVTPRHSTHALVSPFRLTVFVDVNVVNIFLRLVAYIIVLNDVIYKLCKWDINYSKLQNVKMSKIDERLEIA